MAGRAAVAALVSVAFYLVAMFLAGAISCNTGLIYAPGSLTYDCVAFSDMGVPPGPMPLAVALVIAIAASVAYSTQVLGAEVASPSGSWRTAVAIASSAALVVALIALAQNQRRGPPGVEPLLFEIACLFVAMTVLAFVVKDWASVPFRIGPAFAVGLPLLLFASEPLGFFASFPATMALGWTLAVAWSARNEKRAAQQAAAADAQEPRSV